mmetsp:Transcript_12183/g.21181  ORF Transcript_12183/g.21181 Transcript_12183/m.21181 type:complete len:327 (+) Transcript_12183:67-1047(+)
MADENSALKAKLVKQIRQRDADIEALREEAQRLLAQQHSFHDEFEQRVQTLEAKLLRSHLVPVLHSRKDKEQELDTKELENEFHRQRLLELTNYPRNGPEEGEDQDFKQEQALEQMQMNLGLPPPPMLPPGAEVVDLKVHSLHEATLEEWKEEQRLAGNSMKLDMLKHNRLQAQRPPPPVLAGRVIPSNALLTPSPYHPMGHLRQLGFYENVYPITRPPVSVDNVMETSWAGAHAPSYQAYADFFEARQFPPGFCEAQLEYNPGRGGSGPAQFWAQLAGVEERRGTHYDKTWWTRPPPPQPWMLPPWRIPPAERAVVNTCATFFPY